MNPSEYEAIIRQKTFIPVYSTLLEHPYYADLNSAEKMIYSVLYHRLQLSYINSERFSDDGGLYVIYPINDLCDRYRLSKQSIVKYLAHLEEKGLIRRVRDDRNQAAKIYVEDCDEILMNKYTQDMQNEESSRSKKLTSAENQGSEDINITPKDKEPELDPQMEIRGQKNNFRGQNSLPPEVKKIDPSKDKEREEILKKNLSIKDSYIKESQTGRTEHKEIVGVRNNIELTEREIDALIADYGEDGYDNLVNKASDAIFARKIQEPINSFYAYLKAFAEDKNIKTLAQIAKEESTEERPGTKLLISSRTALLNRSSGYLTGSNGSSEGSSTMCSGVLRSTTDPNFLIRKGWKKRNGVSGKDFTLTIATPLIRANEAATRSTTGCCASFSRRE